MRDLPASERLAAGTAELQRETTEVSRRSAAGDPRRRGNRIRGMLVHALSDAAKAFHLRLDLHPSPLGPMTLMTTIAELQSALGR